MRVILRILAIVYIAYLSISVLLIMPALNFLPAWFVKETYGRQLSGEITFFNPFTLSLEVRHLALPEPDGEPFASLDSATVDLSLESLWEPGWVFDEISVHGLYAHVRQLKSGDFNFSDLVPPEDPSAAPPPEEPAAIPGITIHDFAFQSRRLTYTNENREDGYSTHFDNLDIEVTELSTVLEEGRPYRIDANGEGGGSFHWEGLVSVPRATSEGRLRLEGIALPMAWRMVRPWVNFELKDGALGAQARYSVDWGENLIYRVSEGEIGISGLDIRPKTGTDLPDTGVALGAFTISDVSLDSTTQHLAVGGITIDGLSVDGWMEESRISLAELFETNFPEGEESAAPEEEEEADTGPGWTAALGAIDLKDSRVGWRSGFTDPPQLEVAPLTASIRDVRWPLQGDTQLTLALNINQQTALEVGGPLDLGSGDGKISYHLQELPIPWANPNLPKALNAVITDGFLEVQGEVTLAGFAPARVLGGGEITSFAGRMAETEESLTSLESLRWDDLEVDFDQRDVSLRQLTIQKYVGRLHINKDGSINAQNVYVEEVGGKAGELAEDLELDEPWSVHLPKINVAESEIDFMDESLPIVFRTVIGGLYGQVSNISTDPGAVAEVDLQGSVDGYAPVVLAGTAQPMNTPPALDLNLTFDGVDMALLTPYSGTYAGYAIDRGLLNLDLKYALENNRLQGHNSIRIDQMKLGEKVESDKAADLPLELAVALLSDANGVIDLQVPVSGNVDDPAFDVGAVVAKTVMNIITKAVTAPFKLLASLVDSDEDLQRLNFKNGSAELDERGQAKLGQLSQALEQRPSLNMVITGRLNVDADRTRLQQISLRQQMLDDGLPESAFEGKDKAWAKAINERYEALGLPEAGADGEPVSLPERFDAVVARIQVSDNDLQELAEARAVAVKTYLVNDTGMDSGRAVIEQTSVSDEANRFSGVELSVGS